MIGFVDFLLILFAVGGAVFLLRHRRLHEVADEVARQYCQRHHLQFLDGTVSSSGFSMQWRRLELYRSFSFAYSTDKLDRHTGIITLNADRVVSFHVNPAHMRVQETENPIHPQGPGSKLLN